jgi:hypothetical protein
MTRSSVAKLSGKGGLLPGLIEFDKERCPAASQDIIDIRLGHVLTDVGTPDFVVREIAGRF